MTAKATVVVDSGLEFDVTNLFGDGKVTAADLAVLADHMADAHAAVGKMRKTGIVKGHLSKDGQPEKVYFTQLPYVAEGNINSPASLARLKAFGDSLRYRVDAVVSFGIGGSYLGNRVIADVHCGECWNEIGPEGRQGYPKLFFSGQNMDPANTMALIEHMRREAAAKAASGKGSYTITMVVISKSGGTVDTMSTFMVVYEALKAEPGIAVKVVAVTDPATGEQATVLKCLADAQGWPTFAVPDGVGGRFSIFSEVGLVTAACVGFDIDRFLAGARDMDQACVSPDPWKNPALLNAALKYLAAEKYGRDIEVFMPYSTSMKSVSEWYVQLLAESLGKRTNRDGEKIYYGRTPVVAVGTTDMHAQTQQHQDGKKDKVVQFVRIAQWECDPVIPNSFPAVPTLADIAGLRLSQALDAALAANAEALAADGRFNAVFTLPRLEAYYLGQLLYLLALSVAYEGELADVDAFDQPGVEAYKRIMGPKLKEAKATAELAVC